MFHDLKVYSAVNPCSSPWICSFEPTMSNIKPSTKPDLGSLFALPFRMIFPEQDDGNKKTRGRRK